MNATTNAAASVGLLHDAAERAGGRVVDRLAEVHAMLGADMAVVDRELARLVREGLSPATESAAHLLEAGGKRVRPLTVLLAAACFGPPPPAARDLAVVAELVHLATLLHDDVIDDGQERRGRPTPRRIWGNAVSVLAGDLLLTHALERTSAAAPGPVLADLFATLRRLVDGEVVQLRGRMVLDPREEVYFRIVRDKTASLFAWAARAGATIAGAGADAVGRAGRVRDPSRRRLPARRRRARLLGRSATRRARRCSATWRRASSRSRSSARSPRSPPSAARRRGRALGRRARAPRRRRSPTPCARPGTCDGVRALAREETSRALAALEALPPSAARELLGGVARELASRAA